MFYRKIISKKKQPMKKWFKNNLLIVTGALLGGLIGFLYWDNVGCASGTCSITSKPVNSTLYFAVLGAMVFNLFKKSSKENHVKQ